MRPFIDLSPLEKRTNGNGLVIDSVSLEKILSLNRSPVYVTSLNAVAERVKQYKKSLNYFFRNNEVFYAMKANFSSPILEEIKNSGAGIDIVSIGEWRAAVQAGFAPEKICFAGVGKKEEEWKEAITGGLGYLSVEHLSELSDILYYLGEEKAKLKKHPKISLRLNPSIEVDTHPHLKTGALNSKFGILFEHFEKWLLNKKDTFKNKKDYLSWISPLKGLHVHVGSQLTENSIFPLLVKKLLDCTQFMYTHDIAIHHIDFGGGLGVPVNGVSFDGEDIEKHLHFLLSTFVNSARNYAQLMQLWQEDFSKLFVSVEPGRSIVASSTIFLTKVLFEKKNSEENLFCYVDGAMNDFPRPSLYGAIHHSEIVNFKNKSSIEKQLSHGLLKWKIVGPVCESGDFLSKESLLPQIQKGDVIAFFEAGAYCRSMASQYNLRPLPSEIFVKNGNIIKVI
ncbi:diaminopimelate decarboxylase [Silvanigrella aquatica]|uniref:Diaminopimelate decarboxylase n=1 Tax=Silvanigrella aquatica TaxID=1915309 RepID=A0A1L4D082_9BACT|nr:diaminopimelate decarboxylase [Silvanigrella aquatica]APJ03611.1 diaminopimelate decarboxylase [Silvanigrella aquatica]